MNYETRYNKDWMPFAHPLGFIRLILLVDWDPIGILGEAGAMDEYDNYATKVCDILQADGDASEVAAYLGRVLPMARAAEPGRLMALAEKIRRVYQTARASTGE